MFALAHCKYPALLLISLFLLMTGWRGIKNNGHDLMPVRYVRIEGAFQYIKKERIQAVLEPLLEQGFYNVDLRRVKHAVEVLPWTDQVVVQRIWPDAVKIDIAEQQPVARWGDNRLVNAEGDLFSPETMSGFEVLPVIEADEREVKRLLEKMNELNFFFADHGLQMSAFEVNERQSWRLTLSDGLQIIAGRNQPLLKIQRFLNTRTLLGRRQMDKIAKADLRYPNGYALTWKRGSETINWRQVIQQSNTATAKRAKNG